MDNWLQISTGFGIGGAALFILFYIFKSQSDDRREDRKNSRELTEKFIQVTERTNDVQEKAVQATDKLTKLIYKMIKEK